MKILLLIFYFFIITQPTPFLHFFFPPNSVPSVLVLEVIHSHRLCQLRKVDLGEGEMLQRSSIRRLPLPPHTVLGSASAVHRHGNSGGGRWRGLVWSDSLDKSPDPQMTLGEGGAGAGEGGREGDGRWRGGKERAGKRSMPIQSRVIMVARFKGVCTPTFPPCPPPPSPTPRKGQHGSAVTH